MNPRWSLRTARLVLTPVGGADLPDLIAIKADPRVFAVMLGGVRTAAQTQEELARDVVAWGANGFGIWAIREAGGGGPRRPGAGLVGITGLERRPDGRGVALRFALRPDAQGRGLAREAAGAALRFGHDEAGLARIVAVARASNFASRMVLGGVGMTACGSFIQNGWPMVLYESLDFRSPTSPVRAV
ncbi:MAG TPA: GNAT family N-acetyltransferase [Acetobacteraceae bacterium]|nr:GNAT family N-acetyltransferase [Acetobacteraceae bacterium]